jgi:hypothetical protein
LTDYCLLTSISEMAITAGATTTEIFTLYDEYGANPISISSGTLVLCPYGKISEGDISASFNGTPSTNTISFVLSSSITANLSGKYIQQITITDTFGNVFVPAQGTILIQPAIQL